MGICSSRKEPPVPANLKSHKPLFVKSKSALDVKATSTKHSNKYVKPGPKPYNVNDAFRKSKSSSCLIEPTRASREPSTRNSTEPSTTKRSDNREASSSNFLTKKRRSRSDSTEPAKSRNDSKERSDREPSTVFVKERSEREPCTVLVKSKEPRPASRSGDSAELPPTIADNTIAVKSRNESSKERSVEPSTVFVKSKESITSPSSSHSIADNATITKSPKRSNSVGGMEERQGPSNPFVAGKPTVLPPIQSQVQALHGMGGSISNSMDRNSLRTSHIANRFEFLRNLEF